MSVLSCLETVHSSRTRVRYKIRSVTPIPWTLLRGMLSEQLRHQPVAWRLNPWAASLVISYCPPDDGFCDSAAVATTALRQAGQILLAALEDCALTPPPAAVIAIHTHNSGVPTPLRWLLNGLSGGISLGLLVVASVLILIGTVGLMLPLSPGGLLLVLAYGVLELALMLRRPFVNTATI